ncbi:MAG: helix-turn-helix transcriptional regulator [Oscillibacter sp.]|nr:helix-turn-helix transcriptional regulator [Oscillibacter sp.]
MPISENVANFIRRYKDEHHLSIAELSDELDIGKSATVNYLSGDCNPQASTMDRIAEKCGVSVAEIISAQPPGWERAEIVERAARVFGGLPPEQRDRAVSLFLALVDILAEGDHA